MDKPNKVNWFKRHKALTIIGVLVILGIVGAASGSSKKTANVASSSSGSTIPVNTANQLGVNQGNDQQQQPTDPNPHFSDGTWLVGKDIQPGTYRTRKASPSCYWERMADLTGGVDSTLANDNTDYPAVVTIAATDKAFKSERCGTWTQDLSAITTSKTSFTDGTYIVGTDIQPGTYKSSGQSSCYWERMADFSSGTDSTLANDNTDSPAIVTILASDKGFKSSRCGTWTLQQ